MAAAPLPGAAVVRPTARRRPLIGAVLWNDHLAELGYAPDHPYVRRYWTAALGPGSVADLLRLIAAARKGTPVRRPLHLADLMREGLAASDRGRVAVRPTVPPLPVALARRLPPVLRAEHAGLRWEVGHRRSI